MIQIFNKIMTKIKYILIIGFWLSSGLMADVTYIDALNVASNISDPKDVAFNSDGTKMFVIDNAADDITEYTLSTGFDVSTATYVDEFSISGQSTAAYGLTFNNDGTKMYITVWGNTNIYTYTLDTGFDISTASATTGVQTDSFDGEISNPSGMAFNSDGTKYFINDNSADKIYLYTLSTAYDLSTKGSKTEVLSYGSDILATNDFELNSDGTKLFVLDFHNKSLDEYTLSTAYDLTTATHTSNTFSFSTQLAGGTTYGFTFNNDGTKLFMVDWWGADKVHEYTVSPAYTIDSTAPTMTITAGEGADGFTSNDASLALTFTSSEATTDFAEEDITVTNGALSDFAGTSSTVYTATFTPTAEGTATIDVAASTFTDAAGNNNTVVDQFNWTYDVTAPAGTIVNDGTGEDITYTGSDSTLSANWLAFTEDVSGISHYEIGVDEGDVLPDYIAWTSIGDTTTHTFTELNLTNGTLYNVKVRATDVAGNLSDVVSGDGVIVDIEGPLTGTVFDGPDADMDWTNSSTTLIATWSDFSDTLSGIEKYEYAVGTVIGGTDVVDWTDNAIDTTVTRTDLTLANSTAYYVSVRSTDNVGNVSDVVTTDGITVDTDAPVISEVIEGGTDGVDIDYQSSATTLAISWSGSDLVSGISKYEYALGTTSGGTEVKTWISATTDTSVSLSGLSLSNATKYFTSVKATDKAGNVSAVITGDGITIDLTAPSGTIANDGTGDDITYTSSDSTLSANWPGFTEDVSGIEKYEYAIGSTSGGTDIVSWTDNSTNTSVTKTGLSLTSETTYYVSVRATDGASNVSSVITTNGVTADLVGPTIGTITDGSGEDIEWANVNTSASTNWSGFEDVNGIAKYEVALGSEAKGSDVVEWTDIGTATSHTFSDLNLADNTQYFFSVRATDGLGNLSEVAASNGFMVDITAPAISSVSVPTTNTLSIFDNVSIEMTLSEPVLAGNVSFSSAQGDNVGFTQNIEEQTNIIITLAAPFTGGDEFTLTVNGLRDRANNVTDNLEYIYNVALLADYDVDGSIGITDLNTFVSGWEGKDTQFEIGPVTGTAPNFKPALDGIYNARDGMAFVRMWHWDNDQAGKLMAKANPQVGVPLNYHYDNELLTFLPPLGTVAAELFFDYSPIEIGVSVKENKLIQKRAMSLSKQDTVTGKMLIHQTLNKGDQIKVNLQHYQKRDVTIDLSYTYINSDNDVISSGNFEVVLIPLPKEFALHQNYPNPFNPVTTIQYDLPKAAHVRLIIYDIMGREVATILNAEMNAGYQSIIWNTRNNFGKPVSAGIYFYHLQTKDFVKTRKMVLLK